MPLPASIPTQAYRKAFDLYLRRGIPIELPLKAALQEHPTAHFYFGGGKAVELANIGHLQDVIDKLTNVGCTLIRFLKGLKRRFAIMRAPYCKGLYQTRSPELIILGRCHLYTEYPP